LQNFILDACVLLALFNNEEGADIVSSLLDRAEQKEIMLGINAVNLIEVYYDRIRKYGSDFADAIIKEVYDKFPVSIIEVNTPDIVREAARLKARGRMSFADTILVATARCINATIVTCDHAELEHVEKEENIPFLWIRPQF